MTPQSLNRASHAFRRGYNDALNRRDMAVDKDAGTFMSHDYVEGYGARLNEVYWDAQRDNRDWDTIRRRNIA